MVAGVRTRCPHCQVSLKVQPEHLQQHIRCPVCKQRVDGSSLEAALSQATKSPEVVSDTKAVVAEPSHLLEPVSRSGGAQPENASLPSKIDQQSAASSAGTKADRSPSTISSLGQLGRFELRRVLGQGAFGRVYQAYDPQLEREVALKVPTFGMTDAERVRRFLTEAKAAAKLRHPNIVPVYESGKVGSRLFIASQFVDGQPLSKHRKVSFRQAAVWVQALAEALAYAHAEGIVHRDIKPDNIMVDAKNRPHIMDFGLAKRTSDDSSTTLDGSLLGTPAYMAPEQARGNHANVGPAADQYSLGAVLYELLTGQRPFTGPPHAVIAQVLTQEPEPPRSIRPEAPRDLEAICLRAMSKEPDSRYPSLSDLADDLARWLRGEAVTARPISKPERLRRWCRRNPTIATLVGTIITGSLAATLIIAIAFSYTLAAQRTTASALKKAKEQEELALQREREANKQRVEAENERTASAQAAARLSIERGIGLCSLGNFDYGLHWFASAISHRPDLNDPIGRIGRTNFRRWADRLHVLACVVPFDQSVLALQRGDQDTAIAGLQDGTLVTVSLKSSSVLSTRTLSCGALSAIALSRDGRYVATVSEKEKAVMLWDQKTSALRHAFAEFQGKGEVISFSEDSSLLAIGGADGTARVWNIDRSTWHSPNLVHGAKVHSMAISVDNSGVAMCGTYKVTAWSLPIGHKLGEHHSPFGTSSVCFDPHEKIVRMAGWTYSSDLEWPSIKPVRSQRELHYKQSCEVIVYEPGKNYFCSTGVDGSVKVWDDPALQSDPIESKEPLQLRGSLLRHPFPVHCVLPIDKATLVTGCGLQGKCGQLRVWRITAPRTPRLVCQDIYPIAGICLSPSSDYLAVAASTRDVVVLDSHTGKAVSKPLRHGSHATVHYEEVFPLQFSPDETMLAAGLSVGGVALWNWRSGDLVAHLAFPKMIWKIKFSPDSRYLAACGGDKDGPGQVDIWDLHQLDAGSLVITTPQRTRAVEFGSDGTLVAGSEDSLVRFFDMTGKLRETIAGPNPVASFSWLLNGKRFAVGYGNNLVVVHDSTSRDIVGAPLNHGNGVLYLESCNQGRDMLSSDTRSILAWDVETGLSLGPSIGPSSSHGRHAITSSGDEIFVAYEDGKVLAWSIPTPTNAPASYLVEWTEAASGLRVHSDGSVRVLPAEKWREMKQRGASEMSPNEQASNSAVNVASDLNNVLTHYDADRKAAAWAMSLGASPVLSNGKHDLSVPAGELPSNRFLLRCINFHFRPIDFIRLETTAPPDFSNCLALQEVNLGYCQIDDRLVAALARTPSLRSLLTAHSSLSDRQLEHLVRCRTIETLHVHEAALTESAWNHIANLPNLKMLLVGNKGMTDSRIEKVCACRELQDLRIWWLALSPDALRSLQQLPNLSTLEIGKTTVSDHHLREIARLRQLTELRFYELTDWSCSTLAPLAEALRLERLCFGRMKTCDNQFAGLDALRSVTHLDFFWSNATVTDRAIEDLMKARQLKVLKLNELQITKGQLEHLRQALPNCEITSSVVKP